MGQAPTEWTRQYSLPQLQSKQTLHESWHLRRFARSKKKHFEHGQDTEQHAARTQPKLPMQPDKKQPIPASGLLSDMGNILREPYTYHIPALCADCCREKCCILGKISINAKP